MDSGEIGKVPSGSPPPTAVGQLLLVPSPSGLFHSLKLLFTKSKCFTVG